MNHPHESLRRDALRDALDAPVKDLVCGMDVVPGRSKGGSYTFEGREYHFCSPNCRDKFAADPNKYLHAVPEKPGAALETAEFTCPMHPEARKLGPGTCPDCGMALEPVEPLPAATVTEYVCRCTPRSSARRRGRARSAGWRSNRAP